MKEERLEEGLDLFWDMISVVIPRNATKGKGRRGGMEGGDGIVRMMTSCRIKRLLQGHILHPMGGLSGQLF